MTNVCILFIDRVIRNQAEQLLEEALSNQYVSVVGNG